MQDGQALQKRENVPVSIPIFVNGYLTTPGQPAHEVWGMIEDLGFKVEVDYQQAAEKVPQLRSQSLCRARQTATLFSQLLTSAAW